MDLFLKTLAGVLLAAGGLLVFGARAIVGRYKLDARMKCDYTDELDEEGLKQYRINKAMVYVKMLGVLVILPAVVIILVVFR